MEERHNHNHAQGNGFMLGIILGVGVTLLFTTKKGRQLFNYMTEKGLDSFTQLQQRMEQQQIDVENEDSDYIAADERPTISEPEQEAPKAVHKAHPKDDSVELKKESVVVKQYVEDDEDTHEKEPEKKPSRKFFKLRR